MALPAGCVCPKVGMSVLPLPLWFCSVYIGFVIYHGQLSVDF